MSIKRKVFLCYAKEDEAEVKKVYKKLSGAGFSPWMDIYNILPGEQWQESIKRAILDCDFFVVVLSQNSIRKRGFLQREINAALDNWQEKLEDDIYLIPVLIEECEVPERLRGFHYVRLYTKNGWEKIYKALDEGYKRFVGLTNDKGVNLVEKELSKIALCNRIEHNKEYEIDYLCHLVQDSIITDKAFFVQIKTISECIQEEVSLTVKASSLSQWCVSSIPVYLFVVFLGGGPKLVWVNVLEIVSEHFDSIINKLNKREKRIKLIISTPTIFNETSKGLFIKDIYDFHTRLDRSFEPMLALREKASGYIPNDAVPYELKQLGRELTIFSAKHVEARAAIIETYFKTWERIENRFGYGYPIDHVKIAICLCHPRALCAALKSLYYMGSNICEWKQIQSALTFARDNMAYEMRVEGLRDSLSEFHCTPYAGSQYTDFLDKKLTIIFLLLFEAKLVVPAFRSILYEIGTKLEKEREKIRKEAHEKGMYEGDRQGVLDCPDVSRGLENTLENLCSLPGRDATIQKMAIDLYEQYYIISSDEFTWGEKVHYVSYNSLNLLKVERNFDEMSPQARALIIDGLKKHSDPAVRVDCLKVYGRELSKYGKLIGQFIERKLSKTKDDGWEFLCLMAMQNLEKFLTEERKGKRKARQIKGKKTGR